jgi:very-short-patch-repair endonuclease
VEADFELACDNGQRLAIEVDGAIHHEGRKEADKARDAFLQAQGYQVLRVSAREVLETPFEVVTVIGERLRS